MNDTPRPSPDEVERLITAHLAGTLDEPSRGRLGDWIKASPDNAGRFALEVCVHQAIRDHLRGTALSGGEGRSRSRKLLIRAVALAAVCAVGFSVHWYARARQESAYPRVLSAVDARWGASSPPRHLSAGGYQLVTGAVAVSLSDGVEAFIGAPAEFSVEDATTLTLQRGRYTFAHDGPAPTRLKLNVAGSTLSQRGTEYSIDVPDGRSARVIVHSGALDVTSAGHPPRTLVAGSRTDLGEPFPIESSPGSSQPIRRLTWALMEHAGRSAWAGSRLRLVESPDLLFYSNLSPAPSQSTLRDLVHAVGPDASTPLGTLGASEIIAGEGRETHDRAVRFSRQDQALRARIPGRHRELTLFAWIKLMPEDLSRNRHRGLLMADGWGEPGLLHWQLKGAGFRLSFFDKGDGEDPRYAAASDALWDGNWHMLATTISLREGVVSVSHYVDGSVVSTVRTSNSSLTSLRIGDCSIGGWKPTPGDDDPDRHLNGMIDDLLVLSRELTPAEVLSLYNDSVIRRGP